MSVVRVDLFDTTPGATGECAVFAPPERINSKELYGSWLKANADTTARSMYLHFTMSAYTGASKVFTRPTIQGPYSEVLDLFFRYYAALLNGEPATFQVQRSLDF